jgi:hypothetical protein
MFSDLFDPLIKMRYNYGSEGRQYHDFDATKLRFPYESDTTLDINKYILSSRIRITRNLATYTFPSFSTRAERRRVEGKLGNAFQQLSQENGLFSGAYHRLSAIDERLQEKLVHVSIKYVGGVISAHTDDGKIQSFTSYSLHTKNSRYQALSHLSSSDLSNGK